MYVSVLYYISFYLICRFECRIPYVNLYLLGVTILWIISCFLLDLGEWWWKSCLAFNAGTYYAYKESAIVSYVPPKKIVFILALLLILCLLPHIFHRRTFYGAFIKLFQIIFPFYILSLPGKWHPKSRILTFLGYISYEIYLIHGVIIKLILTYYPYLDFYFVMPVVYIVSIILAYSVNKIIGNVFSTAK